MSTFTLDLTRFGNLAKGKMVTVVRKVSLELLRGVVFNTPVDTGRARANWQVSVGAPTEGEVEHASGSGSAAAALAMGAGTQEIQKARGDVAIFLTNNVPYIEALENGHSKQAPEGMVRKTIAQFPYIVEDAAR